MLKSAIYSPKRVYKFSHLYGIPRRGNYAHQNVLTIVNIAE